jgi:probable F420-dependent oxidoreductase
MGVVKRPFRFGLQVPGAATGAAFLDTARRAEASGFDVISMPDHIGNPMWSVWPGLAAIAAVTSTIRLCPFVIDNDFRNPAILAAEAATVDVISNGRVDLGLGAGWDPPDYTRSGIPFDPPGVRVNRLVESIAILKQLYAGGSVTFHGEHYTITDFELLPKAIQQPHPPFLIGGGGKRMIGIAAREANIVSIIMQSHRAGGMNIADGTADSFDQKLGWLRDAAGDRINEIEINALIQRIVVTDHPAEHIERLASDFGMNSVQEAETSPLALIGSIDQIIETIEARRERWGISYLTLRPRYLDIDMMDHLETILSRLSGR